MSWLDAISSGLTAGTQGAAGYLEGQQKGRKEQEARAMQAAALLRQKHIDEQNALMQQAQIGNFQSLDEQRRGQPARDEAKSKLDYERQRALAQLQIDNRAPPAPNNYAEVARHNKAMEALARGRLGAGRPPTQGQLTAKALLLSAESANKILSGDPSGATDEARKGMKDYVPSQTVEQASRLPFGVGNKLATANYQKMRQAALQIADAWLRTTTGAAAPEQEVQRTAMTLIPQAGDSPALTRLS